MNANISVQRSSKISQILNISQLNFEYFTVQNALNYDTSWIAEIFSLTFSFFTVQPWNVEKTINWTRIRIGDWTKTVVKSPMIQNNRTKSTKLPFKEKEILACFKTNYWKVSNFRIWETKLLFTVIFLFLFSYPFPSIKRLFAYDSIS